MHADQAVGVGVPARSSCVVLSAGDRGKHRCMKDPERGKSREMAWGAVSPHPSAGSPIGGRKEAEMDPVGGRWHLELGVSTIMGPSEGCMPGPQGWGKNEGRLGDSRGRSRDITQLSSVVTRGKWLIVHAVQQGQGSGGQSPPESSDDGRSGQEEGRAQTRLTCVCCSTEGQLCMDISGSLLTPINSARRTPQSCRVASL